MRNLSRTATLAAALVGSLAFAGTAMASTPQTAADFTRPAVAQTPQGIQPQGIQTASILSEILNGGHDRHRHYDRHHRRYDSHRHHRHHRHYRHYRRRDQVGRTRPPVSHGGFHGHHHR